LLLPYLLEHPPAHILLAALLGCKPRSSGRSASGSREAAELAAAVGPGFGVGRDVHAGLPRAAILDFLQLRKHSQGEG
jgi:hypothetical protein